MAHVGFQGHRCEDSVHSPHPMSQPMPGVQRCRSISRIWLIMVRVIRPSASCAGQTALRVPRVSPPRSSSAALMTRSRPVNARSVTGLDHGVSHFRLCAVGCACSAGSRTACARLCHAGAAGAGAASAVPPQQGDRTMRTSGVPRSILLLLGVASILCSGCVSKGEYTALLEQYDTLAGP